MGAGILPATIIDGKLHFLFGKENKYADTPGWSDFGGGTETSESFLNTAIREAGEEVTGFLGTSKDIKHLITKYGTINIDNTTAGHSTYRMHVFPMEYDRFLPLYYNNNQKFLQKRLPANVIKKSTIFEKDEIRWICVNDLKRMAPKFRCYFKDIIAKILDKKEEIDALVRKSLKKTCVTYTRNKRAKRTAIRRSRGTKRRIH